MKSSRNQVLSLHLTKYLSKYLNTFLCSSLLNQKVFFKVILWLPSKRLLETLITVFEEAANFTSLLN